MKYIVGERIYKTFAEAAGASMKHCLKYGDPLDINKVNSKGKFVGVYEIRADIFYNDDCPVSEKTTKTSSESGSICDE
jgi:hypothetical protein